MHLATERLTVRTPEPGDVTALLARRNDPELARYQNWTVPFPAEQAEAMVTAAADMGGPVDGEWWMATVTDHHGTVVGDLAVNLAFGGRAAEIGYTFATAHQGRGYATEAAQALVDHLFDEVGVSRIAATLHPDNVASAMLLERLGFVHEGRTRQSYWVGDGDDAFCSDTALYGLTTGDRERWRHRPTGPPSEVTLVEVTHDNYRSVTGLATHKSQERLATPVVFSLADALIPEVVDGAPVVPWFRAIEADGETAGFVMLALTTEHHPNPFLWRLLIDRVHQRRGIGGRALDLVEEFCRAAGDNTIETSWVEGRGSPRPFYEARGYRPTGEMIDGETEAMKRLS